MAERPGEETKKHKTDARVLELSSGPLQIEGGCSQVTKKRGDSVVERGGDGGLVGQPFVGFERVRSLAPCPSRHLAGFTNAARGGYRKFVERGPARERLTSECIPNRDGRPGGPIARISPEEVGPGPCQSSHNSCHCRFGVRRMGYCTIRTA